MRCVHRTDLDCRARSARYEASCKRDRAMRCGVLHYLIVLPGAFTVLGSMLGLSAINGGYGLVGADSAVPL